jgi:uncharacterized SAM-binding protein YcdF (DUF218 family)
MKKFILPLAIIIFAFLISYISLAFFIGNRAESDTKKKSDVIVVLGARSYIDGKYNPCLKARVSHAADLYKEGYAPKLLVSGGNDIEDNVNEAETMKKIAVERGVKAEDILLEKAATSTYENFSLSQQIIKDKNLDSVIIVTEPFHMARASLIADKLQYNYSVSPAIDSPCWQQNKYFSKFFLKEPVAIMQYKLKNRL